MALSFGLVLGLLVIFAGAILYATTRKKSVLVVLVGIGVALVLLTLTALVLAVNSGM